jgi:hypothetical protein
MDMYDWPNNEKYNLLHCDKLDKKIHFKIN